jgi:hypothetical protein
MAFHRSPRTGQCSGDLSLRKIVVIAKDDDRALSWREGPKRRQHHETVSDAADIIGATVLPSRLNQLDKSPALSAKPDGRVDEDLTYVGLDGGRIADPPAFDEALSHRCLNQILGSLAIPCGQKARRPQQSRRPSSHELDVLLIGRHIDLPNVIIY